MTHLASFCAPRQTASMRKSAGRSLIPEFRQIFFASPGIFRSDGHFRECVNSNPTEEGTMSNDFDRRELMALAGLGGLGVVFGSAIAPPAAAQGYSGPANAAPEDFFF